VKLWQGAVGGTCSAVRDDGLVGRAVLMAVAEGVVAGWAVLNAAVPVAVSVAGSSLVSGVVVLVCWRDKEGPVARSVGGCGVVGWDGVIGTA
jgi:hypothetical protein